MSSRYLALPMKLGRSHHGGLETQSTRDSGTGRDIATYTACLLPGWAYNAAKIVVRLRTPLGTSAIVAHPRHAFW